MQTFKAFLFPDTYEFRSLLKPIADSLGEIRDLDVFVLRLKQAAALLDVDHRPTVEAVAGAYGRRREALRERLRVEGGLELPAGLVEAMRCVPWTKENTRPASRVLVPAVRKRWRKLAAIGRRPSPDDDTLHRIRIRAKQVRYGTELVAPAIGPEATRFAAAAEAVQDVLGEHHDAIVGYERLSDLALRLPRREAVVVGMLAGMEIARRERTRDAWERAWRALDRKKLRSWM